MRRIWTIVAALAALPVLAPSAWAGDFTVTTMEDLAGTCANPCSIRQALTSAAATPEEDTVFVPAGRYQLSLGALTIQGGGVTLSGGGARATTIVAGPNARVLEITGTTASISRLTLSGGTATGAAPGNGFHGGTVMSQSSTTTLDRVRVTGGTAYSGGGVANRNGQMLISASLIDHNAATLGGGDGGGIINFGGDFGAAASLTVVHSTIAFNTARLAGGLINYGHPQNAVTLNGVTVARNSATNRGTGGIHLDAEQGSLSVRSSVVASNVFGDSPSNCGGTGPFVSLGYNVESLADCGFAEPTDRRNVDAQLAAALVDLGGDTDVLPPAPTSVAVDLNPGPEACGGSDQRGIERPEGAGCDSGAFELVTRGAPDTTIHSGPNGPTEDRTPTFGFSSDQPATYECRLDGGEFTACPTPYTTPGLADGAHTLEVRARNEAWVVDTSPARRTFSVVRLGPTVTIDVLPPSPTTETSVVFTFSASEPGATFTCTHVFPDGARESVSCESGWQPRDLFEGTHRFEIQATDADGDTGPPALASVVVDHTGPAVEPAAVEPTAFAFTADEAGVTFECRLVGPSVDTGFVACTSPQRYDALAPGDYTFTLVAIDALGNRGAPATRAFSVASPQPQPTVAPIATPRPSTPTPEAGETVVARAVSGRIFVKRPGGSGFVELRGSDAIPVGSEVNAKGGRVRLTIEPGEGKRLQQAVFYAGIFKLSQSGATLDLTLSEPLAACGKKRAGAAQSKAKSRKLWGDGKGKFRTRGRYSAATVRGTIWLVQDSCAGTLTRVRQGVVSVRDRKKTVLVRAGRSYLAKPRR